MANVRELLNKGKCAVADLNGSLGAEQSKGCATLIGLTQVLVAIAPNAEIRKDYDLYAEIDRLLLERKMEIFRGVQTFEQNGSDDATETLPDDTMRVTNEGKYAFTAGFSEGVFFHKVLNSFKGYKRWNWMLIDTQGIWGRETKTGLTGFTTGMVQPTKLGFATPTTGSTEGIRFQFLNRYELDEDAGFILDTNLKKLKGVTEIELEFVNDPMVGDTTATVRAVLAMDESVIYEGADFNDFEVVVNGEVVAATAGDDSGTAGTYPITFSPALAAGDSIILRMPVQKGPDGDYYKSNGTEFTIPE